MVPLLVGRERGLNSSATGWTREGRLNGCAGRFRCWLVKKKEEVVGREWKRAGQQDGGGAAGWERKVRLDVGAAGWERKGRLNGGAAGWERAGRLDGGGAAGWKRKVRLDVGAAGWKIAVGLDA